MLHQLNKAYAELFADFVKCTQGGAFQTSFKLADISAVQSNIGRKLLLTEASFRS